MHTKHLTTPTQALYRVFVQPAISHQPLQTTLRPTVHPIQTIRQPGQQHTQPFSTTSARPSKVRAPQLRKELWDEQITSRQVYIVPDSGTFFDPETGQPPKPVSRYELLRDMDRQTHRLVQVAPGLNLAARGGDAPERGQQQSNYRPGGIFGAESEERGSNWVEIPVCKVVSKKAAYEAASKKKVEMKEKRKISAVASSVKTLELNWAIDANDLGHRIERIQEFLSEGRKVEIMLAAKKKGRKASAEECEAALSRIRKAAGDVDGAKEVGALEGKLGGLAIMRFQGRAPNVTAAKEA